MAVGGSCVSSGLGLTGPFTRSAEYVVKDPVAAEKLGRQLVFTRLARRVTPPATAWSLGPTTTLGRPASHALRPTASPLATRTQSRRPSRCRASGRAEGSCPCQRCDLASCCIGTTYRDALPRPPRLDPDIVPHVAPCFPGGLVRRLRRRTFCVVLRRGGCRPRRLPH